MSLVLKDGEEEVVDLAGGPEAGRGGSSKPLVLAGEGEADLVLKNDHLQLQVPEPADELAEFPRHLLILGIVLQ